MNRIVLFRFHKHPRICKNHLELIKKLNPDIKIYGYSGDDIDYSKFKAFLDPYLENVLIIKNKSPEWFWMNSDLAVRIWYKRFGKSLKFDMLHLVEWDLLLLDSLDAIYRNIPKNVIGLTGLTPLSNVARRWSWTTEEPYKTQWANLLSIAKDRFGYHKTPYASLGPGPCMPKTFLERFSSAKVPEICHDELRLPLFGQILGFRLCDTGFYRKWFDEKEHLFFNCEAQQIDLSIVNKELHKPDGRRAFHPFRRTFDMHL